MSPLQAAVRGGHEDTVELLLQHNALTADGEDRVSLLLDALDMNSNNGIVQMLIDEGISCDNVQLSSRLIALDGDSGNYKWNGIAAYTGKLFCAPLNSSLVLVIDSDTEKIRTIPTNIDGCYKWSGIVLCGTKLFCVPFNSSSVLVIDGDTEEIHTIPCTGYIGNSDFKWRGIAAFGTKLFCAPYHASSILVIDAKTEELRFIPCNVDGEHKWLGIALYGSKLFCSPCCASPVLVIDGESEDVHHIHCVHSDKSLNKWAGITR